MKGYPTLVFFLISLNAVWYMTSHVVQIYFLFDCLNVSTWDTIILKMGIGVFYLDLNYYFVYVYASIFEFGPC